MKKLQNKCLYTLKQFQFQFKTWLDKVSKSFKLGKYPRITKLCSLIQQIDKEILEVIVKYLIIKKLPWLFKQGYLEDTILWRNKLKKYYQNLLIQYKLTKQRFFQILILLSVQYTAQFIRQNLSNYILDNQTLSQFCSLLYNIFLGIKVSNNIYKYLQKTIIGNTVSLKQINSALIIKRNRRRNKQFNKIDQNYQSSPTHRPNIYSKIKLQNTNDQIQPFNQELNQQIKLILNQNLHVKKPERIKLKKLNLKDINRYNTQPNQKQKQLNKQNTKHININSNQLSSSVQYIFNKKIFKDKGKNIKIRKPYTQQSTRLSSNNHQNIQLLTNAYQNKTKRDSNNNYHDWFNLLSQIKKQKMQVLKIKSKCKNSHFESIKKDELKSDIMYTQMQHLMQEDVCGPVLTQIGSEKIKTQQSQKILQRVKHYYQRQLKQFDLFQRQSAQKNKKKRIESKLIKRQNSNFLVNCFKRQSKIKTQSLNQSSNETKIKEIIIQ